MEYLSLGKSAWRKRCARMLVHPLVCCRLTSKPETDSVVGPRVRVWLVELDRLFEAAWRPALRAGLAIAVLGTWDLRSRFRNGRTPRAKPLIP